MNRLFSRAAVWMVGLALLVPGTLQAADVALVIGNADYRRAPDARTAESDARLVAEALSDGGYDVMLGINLDRSTMRARLGRFARKISNADRVVFYFSGHALRSDGESYLAAVDQRNTSLVSVTMDGAPLDLVLRLAASRPGRSVVFVDAAQYNGYTPNAVTEPGLAQIAAPDGVLVVSAAAPGRAIRRRGSGPSRFARTVADDFLRPGNRAMRAARRMAAPAWSTGALRPGFRLVRQGASGGSVNAASPAEIERRLNLTRSQRREVQETLSLLGHDPRGIDGVFGAGSRTAIRLWQRTNNLTETGYLDTDQHALLLRQGQEAGPGRDDRDWERAVSIGTGDAYRDYLAEHSDGRHADGARDALKRMARAGSDDLAYRERRFWRQARQDNIAEAYRDYLERYPNGIWQPEAEERLAALGSSSSTTDSTGSADPADEERALNLTRNDRLSVEQRLNILGFSPGAMDGFFDSSTRWAIEGYQRSRGFEANGYLDRPVLSRLVEETGRRGGVVIDGATVLRDLLGLE